jgi:hypothetical protein
MTEYLPTTREAWERDFPGLQTRYLAWCNAMRRLPSKPDMIEFMCWINQRRAAYLKERQDMGDDSMIVVFGPGIL